MGNSQETGAQMIHMTRDTLLERSIALVTSSSLSSRNKELALTFKDNCLANGLSPRRVSKYLWQLRQVSQWLGKDFDKATIDDLKRVVATVETSGYAPWTKCDYRVALRVFYRWLSGGENYPDLVRWIRPRHPRGRDMMPSDLLTEDDIKKMVSAADHPRDRALVACLYESGARIGEVLGIRLRDMVFDKYGVLVMLNGKTGPRRIRLVACVPFLQAWLNRHPDPNSSASPLWVTKTHKAGQLTYTVVRQLLLMLRRRARIQKPVNPHHFRHSRATFLANHLTEAQMKDYLGWVQSSEMAAVYVHLSGRDVDRAILGLHGLADPEDQNSKGLSPLTCARCLQANEYTNSFCSKCGFPLNERAGIELIHRDVQQKETAQLLDQMMETPDFRAEVARRLREALRDLASASRASG